MIMPSIKCFSGKDRKTVFAAKVERGREIVCDGV
jgi:hypothetical protein